MFVAIQIQEVDDLKKKSGLEEIRNEINHNVPLLRGASSVETQLKSSENPINDIETATEKETNIILDNPFGISLKIQESNLKKIT